MLNQVIIIYPVNCLFFMLALLLINSLDQNDMTQLLIVLQLIKILLSSNLSKFEIHQVQGS